ncbi:MAG TPA: hypothetical protein VJ646_11525, partial [Candidatus Binatia bacterium]|nr:hypothetical protein [Candidatus Binatia bacterium]
GDPVHPRLVRTDPCIGALSPFTVTDKRGLVRPHEVYVALIETEPPRGEEKDPLNVSHCFLWPELHECDQRCIR